MKGIWFVPVGASKYSKLPLPVH